MRPRKLTTKAQNLFWVLLGVALFFVLSHGFSLDAAENAAEGNRLTVYSQTDYLPR